ncbi:hypothetical protein LXD69_15460 [Flavobacterium sediminilitoris]|uniref:MoxR-vWA-beta-propeller ternary system domain-containing protein n=1 Tax=Flavobacterium sediminilitoris TaxID=2024526 RepID=A0ABY4HM66_9FLAO|nr:MULTISPECIES: hypothetical protein [Flavobacterium]UOX33422.1 hypothetical protein LXD69_15460 [Flavobacterium sediminilitoris]
MYYVELHKSHLEYLAPIRHWDNLKLAFEGERAFIKDFTPLQINDVVLLQIPHIIVYELKEQLLFRKDKLVPTKKLPSALLWMPILNALPIDLPKYNMNYFGIHDKIDIKIVKSEAEQKPYGVITKLENVKGYIETLPQVRLQNLKWIIIEDSILFLGTPLLPIKGQTYWLKDNCLFPTGYALEFDVLFPIIKKQLNPNNDSMLLFQNNNSYLSIPLSDCKPLSLSSFRLTVNE